MLKLKNALIITPNNYYAACLTTQKIFKKEKICEIKLMNFAAQTVFGNSDLGYAFSCQLAILPFYRRRLCKIIKYNFVAL
jgi:hypothetical protein